MLEVAQMLVVDLLAAMEALSGLQTRDAANPTVSKMRRVSSTLMAVVNCS